MDGRADVQRGVGGIKPAHRPGKEVAAVHPVGPQIQTRRQEGIAGQRDGHPGKQGQAEPPEVAAGSLPEQIEQGEGDPRKPCKVGDDRILAEGDQIIQPAVDPDVRNRDVRFQPMEGCEIKDEVKRHESDGMAGKPIVSHGKTLPFRVKLKFLSSMTLYAPFEKKTRPKQDNFNKKIVKDLCVSLKFRTFRAQSGCCSIHEYDPEGHFLAKKKPLRRALACRLAPAGAAAMRSMDGEAQVQITFCSSHLPRTKRMAKQRERNTQSRYIPIQMLSSWPWKPSTIR